MDLTNNEYTITYGYETIKTFTGNSEEIVGHLTYVQNIDYQDNMMIYDECMDELDIDLILSSKQKHFLGI